MTPPRASPTGSFRRKRPGITKPATAYDNNVDAAVGEAFVPMPGQMSEGGRQGQNPRLA